MAAKAILILGMHRSGTSVLTRLVNLLGAELGSSLMAAEKGNNDKGFWEHWDIVTIHEELLAALDHDWDTPVPLPDNWWKSKTVAPFRKRLLAIIKRDFADSELWCVKDPRLCLLLPLWNDMLDELGLTPLSILASRNPLDVAASLNKRDAIAEEKGLFLWLLHTLEAEHASRDHKRVIVSYESIMQNWQETADILAKALDITWPSSKENISAEVESFIDPSLRHHGSNAEQLKKCPAASPWVLQCYEAIEASYGQSGKRYLKRFDTLYTSLYEAKSNLSCWTNATLADSGQLQSLREQLAHVSDHNHQTNLSLQKNAQTLAELQESYEKSLTSLEHTKQKLKAAEMAGHEWHIEYERMKETRDAILRSISWKITAPLRLAIDSVKEIKKSFTRNSMPFSLENGEDKRPVYLFKNPNDEQVYPHGWNEITINLSGQHTDTVSYELLLNEREQLSLQPATRGIITTVQYIPPHTKALRLICHKTSNDEVYANGATLTTISKYEAWYLTFWPPIKKRLLNPAHLVHSLKKLRSIWQLHGTKGVVTYSKIYMYHITGRQRVAESVREWASLVQPNFNMLNLFRERNWPKDTPKFSIVMCVYNTRKAWLDEAITSVIEQTYPHWQLVLVDDASPEAHIAPMLHRYANKYPQITLVTLDRNQGVSHSTNAGIAKANGDYILFMDHDDCLAPHALHRFAEAILEDHADILYADEAITAENIHEVTNVVLRPAFAYEYYLNHPYFVHPVAIRRSIVEAIGGLDTSFQVSQDVDLILRALEQSSSISHIPDILYFWRTYGASLGHEKQDFVGAQTREAIAGHLARQGIKATVEPGKSFNFYSINYEPAKKDKIAIIIPTKNRDDLLRMCIDSLEKTVKPDTADIYVIDHDSDAPSTQAYLKEIAKSHTVFPYSGTFNFSAIMNFGVKSLPKPYTHYLFLNNDIEALDEGWLEHMLGLASQPDIGMVGSLLLYPNRQIQHGGVIVGLHGAAEHAHKFEPYEKADGGLNLGFNGALIASREWSAVTAACLLMRADVFEKINGFDETLAVGFGDVDLCLRCREAGYRVIMDNQAVLIHHESVSRGKSMNNIDPHPTDSKLFRERYEKFMQSGDPYYHPMLSLYTPNFGLNQLAKVTAHMKPRTTLIKKRMGRKKAA